MTPSSLVRVQHVSQTLETRFKCFWSFQPNFQSLLFFLTLKKVIKVIMDFKLTLLAEIIYIEVGDNKITILLEMVLVPLL
jgi:hypothetical protein